MEVEQIKEQAKNWLDSRLKNPYFGSVIAVWLVTNRVLVFGAFNFDNTNSLEQRVSWVHNQLESFKLLNFFWGFHGFFATVIWSLLWGYIVMIVFNNINGVGKILFKWSNKRVNNLLQKSEPDKWIETNEYFKSEKKSTDFEDELYKKKIEIKRIQKEYDDTLSLYSKSEKEKTEKDKLLSGNTETIQLQVEQIKQFTEEKNRFRIIYARYGKNEEFKEVTKIVSDLILSKGKFIVENNELGGDPLKFTIKELFIEYEFGQQINKLFANENEIVELKENKLVSIQTDKSKQSQLWLQNQNKVGDVFKGEWTLTYTKDGKPKSQTLRIDNTGKYFINGIHTFNLLVTEFNNKQINLKKINLKREVHSTEILTITNDKLIIGKDNVGYILEYKKNDSPNFQMAMNIALKDRENIYEIIKDHPEYSLLKISSHENTIKKNYFTLIISNANDLIYSSFENFLKVNMIEFIDYHKRQRIE